jgi:hypothetical protein
MSELWFLWLHPTKTTRVSSPFWSHSFWVFFSIEGTPKGFPISLWNWRWSKV